MEDSVIFEALKVAMVEAFFQQQSYYAPDGVIHNYGGNMIGLIEKMLASDGFKVLSDKLAEDIIKEEGRFKEKLKEEYHKKVSEAITKKLSDGYYFDNYVNNTLDDAFKEEIVEMVKSDDKLRKRIFDQINTDKYDINVSVSISVAAKI